MRLFIEALPHVDLSLGVPCRGQFSVARGNAPGTWAKHNPCALEGRFRVEEFWTKSALTGHSCGVNDQVQGCCPWLLKVALSGQKPRPKRRCAWLLKSTRTGQKPRPKRRCAWLLKSTATGQKPRPKPRCAWLLKPTRTEQGPRPKRRCFWLLTNRPTGQN